MRGAPFLFTDPGEPASHHGLFRHSSTANYTIATVSASSWVSSRRVRALSLAARDDTYATIERDLSGGLRMRYLALATDYDATLAWHGMTSDAALDALKRLRASG